MNEHPHKVIVLFSGGQDSTTCLLKAVKECGSKNVYALGFDYGQTHWLEMSQAKKIADLLNVPYEVKMVKGLLGRSSLTDRTLKHSDAGKIDTSLPASFTAGRNALFLVIAASMSYDLKVFDIVTGVCQTDYSGYPDCRRDFIDHMQVTLSLGLGRRTVIHTPLMYLTKAQTWKLAKDLGEVNGHNAFDIVRDLTVTDYDGDTTRNEWGMGRPNNPASKLRAKGYYEAKEYGWI